MFKVLEKFATKALTPLKGSVSFIPVCNPKAFDANVRQIDENLTVTPLDEAATCYTAWLACKI